MVVVAVVDNGAVAEARGLRPANGSGTVAGGKIPLNFGRLAGIAWILPVDVPAGVEVEEDASDDLVG